MANVGAGCGDRDQSRCAFFYKYTNFLVDNLSELLLAMGYKPLPAPSILLPVGISFITFEKISFLVDIYRGVARFPRNIIDYALYVFFFPKLLAGPIIKYHEIDGQIANLRAVDVNDCLAGLERFMLGVVKKALVADPLGVGVTQIFALPDGAIGFTSAWIGVGLFTLQIYFDFSAYSDMAIGLGRLLGFRLNENFNLPYLSRSISEFWRRWHISFSTYVREYLYVPLGGNRVSTTRIYVNLWICFLLSGVWHGANWTFVIWGAYNGAFLTLERMFLLRWLDRLRPEFANAITLVVIMFGWTVFRASSLHQAGAFYSVMVNPLAVGAPLALPAEVGMVAAAAVVVVLAPRFVAWETIQSAVSSSGILFVVSRVGLVLLFTLACANTVAQPFRPFLYFRF